MSANLRRARQILRHRRLAIGLAVLAFLIATPGFLIGWQMDDYMIRFNIRDFEGWNDGTFKARASFCRRLGPRSKRSFKPPSEASSEKRPTSVSADRRPIHSLPLSMPSSVTKPVISSRGVSSNTGSTVRGRLPGAVADLVGLSRAASGSREILSVVRTA